MAIEGTKSEDPGKPIITKDGIFYPTGQGYEFINPDGTKDSVKFPEEEEKDPGYTEEPEENDD